jgi:hypothetical protein
MDQPAAAGSVHVVGDGAEDHPAMPMTADKVASQPSKRGTHDLVFVWPHDCDN